MATKTPPKPDKGIGRPITLADGTETTQVLSDSKIALERKLRGGRLPHGYGTKHYDELMSKHRKLKVKQSREREARRERLRGPDLTDAQEAAVARQVALSRGNVVVNGYGDPVTEEAH